MKMPGACSQKARELTSFVKDAYLNKSVAGKGHLNI
jgi:hypothetical protein